MSTTPLLTYAFNTIPNPLTAGDSAASINLLATNNSNAEICIYGIELAIPVGDAGNELTSNPGQVVCIPPQNWKLQFNDQPGLINIVFLPEVEPSAYCLLPGKSLLFTIVNIAVNGVEGTVNIKLTEGSEGNPAENILVSKFPAGWGEVNFMADPSNIENSGNITLRWNGPARAGYTIQYLDNQDIVNIPLPGQAPLAASGNYPGDNEPPLSISATTVFTLLVMETINGVQYETQAQQTVMVGHIPVITSFTGQLTGAGNDQQLLLSWTTTNANSMEGSWTP